MATGLAVLGVWFRRWAVACVAALAGFSVAHANPPQLQGVWRGTIGKAAVMACLDGVGKGHFYYTQHRRGIWLQLPDRPGGQEAARAPSVEGYELEEFPPFDEKTGSTGRWRFEALRGNELSGTWSSAAGDRHAPIRLSRVVTTPGTKAGLAGECPDAFYEPLLAAMSVTRKPARFRGHDYVEVASQQGKALEVAPDFPHADALNRHALEWLQGQALFAYECDLARFGGYSGGESHLRREMRPVAWTDRYLVLQDSLPYTYCGGAHGSSSLSYAVWSVATGQIIDTWAWLTGGDKAVQPSRLPDGQPRRSRLEDLVVRLHPRSKKDDSCAEVMDVIGIEAPYPVAGGLVFNTVFFHAAQGCDAEVKLSWKQLTPFLSAQGRAVMRNETEDARPASASGDPR